MLYEFKVYSMYVILFLKGGGVDLLKKGEFLKL